MSKKSLLPVILLTAASVMLSCSQIDVTGNMPDLTGEDDTAVTYDWGTLAETEPPDTSAYTYEFSRYAVTENRLAIMSDSAYAAYMTLVDAIESHSPSIEVTAGDVGAVMETLCECYPAIRLVSAFTFTPPAVETVAESDTAAESDTSAETETEAETDAGGNSVDTPEPAGTLALTYVYDADTHAAYLAEFYRQTAKIMTNLNIGGVSDTAAAILLYSWTAQNVTDMTGRRVTSFNTLYSGGSYAPADYDIYISGGSQSTVYQYLLLQAGIKCSGVTGKLGASNRMWCAVNLGGEWYYCDPSLETSGNGGRGLAFFGMNDAGLAAAGFDGSNIFNYNMTGGIYYTNDSPADASPASDFNISSGGSAFEFMRDCDYYTYDTAAATFSIYHEGVAQPDEYKPD